MFKLRIVWYFIQFTLRGKFNSVRRLQRFQQGKWRYFVKKTLTQSPFYEAFARKNADLNAYPLMDKPGFMTHFSQINTRGIQLETALELALEAEKKRDFQPTLQGVTVGLSTGTSGKRGVFLVSEIERAQWAALVMSRVLKMDFRKKQKVAFFLRANSNLYSSVQSNLLEFQFFDIFQPIPELIQAIKVFQPDVIAAQPSVMAELAMAQTSQLLALKPRQLISFAEVLWPDDRAFFETTFKAPLTEVYQCTEGFLGVTCREGVMHLNEDLFFLKKRYVGPDRFVPIITDFTRSTQPLIRYELNDVLVERKTPCPCGSVFLAIEQIEGREDDVLLFETINGTEKIFPDLICRRIAQRTDLFRRYRLTQLDTNVLQLELETSPEDFQSTAKQIQEAIFSLLQERNIQEVEFSVISGMAFHAGEKLRRIVRYQTI
jgi:putative adenylate-forming enzyme